MGRRHSVRAASVKAAVIRFTKLVFLKQVRVKRDQPHWLTDEGTRIGRPNSEGARASRPDRKESSISRRKDWLCLPKRALLSWPGRSAHHDGGHGGGGAEEGIGSRDAGRRRHGWNGLLD